MDMNGDYNFGLEKSHRDGLPAEWQFNTSAMGVVAANTYLSSPMVEAFAPGHWSHSTGPPNLGLGESNILSTTGAINSIPIGKPVVISSREMLLSTVPGVFPASLHHFPTDSGFIERATRFSCFSGGNFSGMNLLGPSQPMASQFQKAEFIQSSNKAGSLLPDHGSPTASPNQNLMDRSSDISNSNSESHEANFSEDGPEGNAESTDVTGSSSPSELTANKRRKTIQDTRKDQVQRSLQPSLQTTKENTEAKQKVVQVNSKHTGKNGKDDSLQTTKENTEAKQKVVQVNSKHTGKNGKDDSEVAKEGFVHVRARRGQATNSHSLAERVRREKISERMKYLQELVPGCSKVTGKAFMLDEIINYVQSLQRQVEFLSMKLAAVNPQLDFSMEGLVSKHLLHSHSGSSSAARFSQDMIYPQAYPSQQGLVLAGISSMANNSDTFRRSTNSQLQTCNFKELSLQMHNRWNEELISQIVSYGANPPPNAQEMDIKTDGFAI